jgi:predicted RNA binding protein YcfA (HicA-like mRNA interferase family)
MSPKLKKLSGSEVCRILEKKTEDTTITVPVPDHKEIKTGTLLSIIRQSGIQRVKFEAQ